MIKPVIVQLNEGEVPEFPVDFLSPANTKKSLSFVWNHKNKRVEPVTSKRVIVDMGEVTKEEAKAILGKLICTVTKRNMSINNRDQFVHVVSEWGRQGFAVIGAS